MIRILRLGNSDDTSPGIPDDQRAYALAAQVLEDAAGQPVETVVRTIWPGPELPGLIDEWLDRYKPDLVFLKVTWYWYGYESVPLRLERRLRWIGKPFARAGKKAADSPRLARNPTFRRGRRLAHRLIGGDSDFTTGEVIECMQACIRKVVAREDIGLVVKGTGDGRRLEGPLADYFESFQRKRVEVEGTIEAFCRNLGIIYVGTGKPRTSEEADLDARDDIHKGMTGHKRVGLKEGEALVAGWRAMHAPDGSTPEH